MMLASAQVRHQLRRFLAPGLAVALGVAFLAATIILGASLRSSITATLTGDLQSYAAVATSAVDVPLTTAQRDAVTQLPGVREVTATRRSVAVFAGRTVQLMTPPAPTSAARLSQGRRPMASDEAAISLKLATATGLQLGSVADVLGGLDTGMGTEAGSGGGVPDQRMVTVVGIVDAGRDPRFGIGQPIVFMTDDGVTAVVGDQGFTDLRVSGEGRDLVTQVAAVVGGIVAVGEDFPTAVDRPIVQSGPDAAHGIANALGRAATLTTSLVAALVTVALLVCGIVVANTFAILLTRRGREIALLRCVGATRGQVIRQVITEATLLGFGFSALGVLAGLGLAVGLGALAGRAEVLGGTLRIELPWWGLLGSLLAGLVVTIVASVVPALRAGEPGPWKGCTLENSHGPAAGQDGPGSSPAWHSSLSARPCSSWAREG